MRRSVPGVVEPLGVATLGLATTDANDVKAIRAGLKRSDHRRSDAQNVPRRKLDHLVIELGTTGTADHHVRLLLLTVTVTPWHSGAWLIGEAAHAKFRRSQNLPREPPLDMNILRTDVAEVVEVLLRPVGQQFYS
jgi:hypothetical protein